jgi:hypothetical protein
LCVPSWTPAANSFSWAFFLPEVTGASASTRRALRSSYATLAALLETEGEVRQVAQWKESRLDCKSQPQTDYITSQSHFHLWSHTMEDCRQHSVELSTKYDMPTHWKFSCCFLEASAGDTSDWGHKRDTPDRINWQLTSNPTGVLKKYSTNAMRE